MRFLAAIVIGWLFLHFMSQRVAAELSTPTVIAEDLITPWGVAIQLSTNTPYIADSARGRIVRIVDGKLEEAVVGFSTEAFQHDPKRTVGPMSLSGLTPAE